jgi:hypothetical protein
VSRHSAKQLPRTGHGDSLCKHTSPGSCTWWCSYSRFVKVCLVIVAAVGAFGAISYFLDESGGLGRLKDAGIALGLYLVVVVGMVVFANRRDGGDHY